MKKQLGIRIKLILVIIPVVLVLIFSFFALSRGMIVRQAKDNLMSESSVYAGQISAWSDGIFKELNVYADTINKGVFANDKEILRYLETTSERNTSYPAGLYMGDDKGVYLDYVSELMSQISVGGSGKAFLVAKDSQTVLAHPDASMIDAKLTDSNMDAFYQNIGQFLQ